MICCGDCAVSDNAADYLTAIARQPLLAVGAVAPELYGRVPALARAHELRLRSSRALSAARGAGPAASARVRWLPGAVGAQSVLACPASDSRMISAACRNPDGGNDFARCRHWHCVHFP